jgi:hypothetical protein
MKFFVGDKVRMRKEHPCGGKDWEILRVGMDFRLKCLTCGRVVLIPRVKFEKGVKSVIESAMPETMGQE